MAVHSPLIVTEWLLVAVASFPESVRDSEDCGGWELMNDIETHPLSPDLAVHC